MECRKRPKSVPTLEHFPTKCEAVRRRTRIRKETGACSDSKRNGTYSSVISSRRESAPPDPDRGTLTGPRSKTQFAARPQNTLAGWFAVHDLEYVVCVLDLGLRLGLDDVH